MNWLASEEIRIRKLCGRTGREILLDGNVYLYHSQYRVGERKEEGSKRFACIVGGEIGASVVKEEIVGEQLLLFQWIQPSKNQGWE